MRLNFTSQVVSLTLVSTLILSSFAQTITSNRTGTQGGFVYEYWKDSGNGTMILGEGGDFSCTWDAHNILFRKGIRPGSKNQLITYEADYKPNGNSYLTVYGWTKNPLIEYYIVESWGSWRPPGGQSKGTIESDGGTYDIYETTRTNQPSIEGTKTFQQYWSVRKTKKESGEIHCANHFNAWEAKGMRLGSFYEVAFNVEGWQSSGSADVHIEMTEATAVADNTAPGRAAKANLTTAGLQRIEVTGSTPMFSFSTPEQQTLSFTVYDFLGREVSRIAGREYSAGSHSVPLTASRMARGVYYCAMKAVK